MNCSYTRFCKSTFRKQFNYKYNYMKSNLDICNLNTLYKKELPKLDGLITLVNAELDNK